MVVVQARRYQIDICHNASEYPTNAVTPANRKTCSAGALAGSARPATYAAKHPTATAYRNHCTSCLPIDMEPPGHTVNIMTGPFLNFSRNCGGRISSLLAGRGIMLSPGGMTVGGDEPHSGF